MEVEGPVTDTFLTTTPRQHLVDMSKGQEAAYAGCHRPHQNRRL